MSDPRIAAVVRLTAATGTVACLAVTGCSTIAHRRLDFSDTEAVRITRITVLPGSGDVVVRTATVGETRIKRVVRYRGAEPKIGHRIDGTELFLDTDCGPRCSVTYTVLAPRGVAVRGENCSGDVELTEVGAVDLRVGSGDVTVSQGTGQVSVETDSGDITVSLATPVSVQARAEAGSVTVRVPDGRYRVKTSTESGDSEVRCPTTRRRPCCWTSRRAMAT